MGCGKQDCVNGGLRRRSCKASPVSGGGPYPIRRFAPPSPASWGRDRACSRSTRWTSRRDSVSPRAPRSDALDLASCDFRTISSSAGCRSLLSGYARRFAKRELAPLPREVGEGGAERRMGCGKQDCDNGGLRRRSCKASPVGGGGPYPIRPFGPPSPAAASWGRVCALTRPSRSPRATGAARLLARLRPSGLAQHIDGRTTRSRG